MPNFTVTVSRSTTEIADIDVTAKDKRTAAMVAGPLLADAKWTTGTTGEPKITGIEKLASANPAPGRGRRKAA